MAEALFRDGGFVTFVPGGEVVFEGVHVRWEFCDFAEDDGEIEGEEKGDQVKAAVGDSDEEGGEDDLVCCAVTAEKCLPSALRIFCFCVLGPGHQRCEDEEGNQASIDDCGE